MFVGYPKAIYKQLMRNPVTILVLVLPIILLLGLGNWLPAAWIIPSTITISLIVSVMFFFGGVIYDLRKNSMIKPMALTRMTKFYVFSVTILATLALAFFSWALVLFFGWLFSDVLHLLATDFSAFDPNLSVITAGVDWKNIDWFTMIYVGFITIILSFAIIFFITTISKTSQSLYAFSFLYIIIVIILGGVIIPPALAEAGNSFSAYFAYLVPHHYTNNMMASAFTTTGVSPTQIDYYFKIATEVIGVVGDINPGNWTIFINDFIDSGAVVLKDGAVSYIVDINNINEYLIANGETYIYWTEAMGVEKATNAIDITNEVNILNALLNDVTFTAINTAISTISGTYPILSDFGNLGTTEIDGVISLSSSTGGVIIKYATEILNLIWYENLENTINIWYSWIQISVSWNISDWKSALDIFVPISLIVLFGILGIKNFKWSQR